MSDKLTLDPKRTALILIDLQRGILGIPSLAPHTAADVLERGKALADRFRAADAPVVLVHVDFRDAPPSRLVDQPMGGAGLPPDFAELADDLRRDGDIVVRKRHWGAFSGTELDLHLRRRGIDTVVIAGISTGIGVESTARSAWELSYHVVIATDACSSLSQETHDFSLTHILPRIARLRHSDEIALG